MNDVVLQPHEVSYTKISPVAFPSQNCTLASELSKLGTQTSLALHLFLFPSPHPHHPTDNLIQSPAKEYSLSLSHFPEFSHPITPLSLPEIPSLLFFSYLNPTHLSNLAQILPSLKSCPQCPLSLLKTLPLGGQLYTNLHQKQHHSLCKNIRININKTN